MFNRRSFIASAFCGLAVAPSVAISAEPLIAHQDLYNGSDFSVLALENESRKVAMEGFMAPPLKAEANFFVLTEVPLSLCPFCSSDADWPDDIVVIYLDRAQTFEQANGLIEVRGMLEVGSWTDPETGFVSLLRIVGADFHRA